MGCHAAAAAAVLAAGMLKCKIVTAKWLRLAAGGCWCLLGGLKTQYVWLLLCDVADTHTYTAQHASLSL
jgi:hypothetical protein